MAYCQLLELISLILLSFLIFSFLSLRNLTHWQSTVRRGGFENLKEEICGLLLLKRVTLSLLGLACICTELLVMGLDTEFKVALSSRAASFDRDTLKLDWEIGLKSLNIRDSIDQKRDSRHRLNLNERV